ncbi:MAG: DNA primase [Clostridiales bacterium]|nr:DNA primase [Clostridiales bacterium]
MIRLKIDPHYLQELHSRLDIENVVSPYVHLTRAGKNLKGLCPFHNEKTPSFTVYTGENAFHCFGCGAHGDSIGFIMRIENLDFIEAVKTAAEMAHMPLPEDNFDDSLIKQRRRILDANREAARYFHSCLMSDENKKALDYFLKRNLSLSTIRHFGLGYAPDDWEGLIKHLKSLGFTENEMVLANLAKRSERGRVYVNFKNRVIFPIIDVRGNIIAFGGRVMDDSKPKYINTSDTPVYKKSNGVFALNFAKSNNTGKRLILVEGYMDVISLHQVGITDAIACLGTAFTDEMALLLSRYAEEIYICYDNDDAGRKATERALNVLNKTGLKVKVVAMTGGKDADEIIRTYGRERFESILKSAFNEIEYTIEKESSKYILSTDDGKTKFLTEMCRYLSQKSEIERSVYASRLASMTGSDEKSISAAIDGFIRKAQRERNALNKSNRLKEGAQIISGSMTDTNNPEKTRYLSAAKAEERLIAVFAANPDFYKKLSGSVSPDDFVTGFNKRIFEHEITLISAGVDIDYYQFQQEFSPGEMYSIQRILNLKNSVANTITECYDCIEKLKNHTVAVSLNPNEMSDDEYLAAISKKKERGT